MRTLPAIFTASLLLSLAACDTPGTTTTDIPVVDGNAVISYAMAAQGARVRIGGKTFQVAQRRIAWNSGSLDLKPDWGLLELRDSPAGVEINLDGVVVTTVAK